MQGIRKWRIEPACRQTSYNSKIVRPPALAVRRPGARNDDSSTAAGLIKFTIQYSEQDCSCLDNRY